MKAEIICVGTELLLGDILNTNACFLARQLADLGISVYHQQVVGDNPQRLAQVVEQAMERSDLLVFSGGLGPTADDLTKHTVAQCFEDTLELNQEILAQIAAYYARTGRTMPPSNEKQALVPSRGGWFCNHNGTAPGIWLERQGVRAILLPGPPKELEPLWHSQVRPWLEQYCPQRLYSLVLRVVGIGESHLEQQVSHLLEGSNPTAALYAKTSEVHIRITAMKPDAHQARLACQELAQAFYAILGDAIYAQGEVPLEQALVEALLHQQKTLATAESCTGGLVSQSITNVPGSSQVFGFGFCTYANQAKEQLLGVEKELLQTVGAVSSEVAAQMAQGAAKAAQADFGLGITGIAGPGGGTEEKPVGLVYVSVCSGSRVAVKKLTLGQRSRQTIRESAATHAMDMARRLVLGLPIPGAQWFAPGDRAVWKEVQESNEVKA